MCLLFMVRGINPLSRKLRRVSLHLLHRLLLFFSLLVILGCLSAQISIPKEGSIVCFGDSLTEGSGAGIGEDYPTVLSNLLNEKIVNAGRSGDTTEDALMRLDSDVLSRNPRLTIVLLGGNDFLTGKRIEDTYRNIEEIVKKIKESGSAVLLISPIGRYDKGYQRIATKYNCLFIPHILRSILGNPKYKYDSVHPNSKGYRVMAEMIYKKIEPYL
ncbi:MAG TPA: arylesterase [Candidatus Omnitrophica bacterium]|nr:arylesterase [Candidatus Omnitrophota bacterium]